jgi:TPR repeat protein
LYYRGEGVPQDYAEAVKLCRKVADLGVAPAQFRLGIMYTRGQGVPQNDAEAIDWFRKAAEQGDTQAQINLSAMCAKHNGVAESFVRCHMWAELAAAALQGDPQKHAFEVRDQIAAMLTPAEIAEAQRLAREWKPSPAK